MWDKFFVLGKWRSLEMQKSGHVFVHAQLIKNNLILHLVPFSTLFGTLFINTNLMWKNLNCLISINLLVIFKFRGDFEGQKGFETFFATYFNMTVVRIKNLFWLINFDSIVYLIRETFLRSYWIYFQTLAKYRI